MCAMCSFIIQCSVCSCCFASAPMHAVQLVKSLQCSLCLQHPQSAAGSVRVLKQSKAVLGLSLCSVEYCTIVQCVFSVQCGAHGVRASLNPSWFFVGRRTFTLGIWWMAWGETDRHAHTNRQMNTRKYTNTHETQYTHHIQTER